MYLGHIAEAASAIEAFTAEGRDALFANLTAQSAVIRRFELIDVAVKQVSAELTTANPQSLWRQIAGSRDRLIHGYFRVDLDAVWSMVEQDLPSLRAAVARRHGSD